MSRSRVQACCAASRLGNSTSACGRAVVRAEGAGRGGVSRCPASLWARRGCCKALVRPLGEVLAGAWGCGCARQRIVYGLETACAYPVEDGCALASELSPQAAEPHLASAPLRLGDQMHFFGCDAGPCAIGEEVDYVLGGCTGWKALYANHCGHLAPG